MRTFLTIWSGQLVSLIGSGLTSFALGVWIYEQTGSVTQFALNMVAFFVPGILVAPIAGVIADRYDRRLVMILSDSLAAFSTVSMFALFITGNLQVWQIYVATALNAIANTFQWPAYGAAVTMLVPKEHLGRASGMTQAAQAISELVSPAAAGVLYVSVGMQAIFLVDFATFLVSIATLLAVRIPHPERTTSDEENAGSFLTQISFGWKYLKARRGLLYLLLVFAAANFSASLVFPLFGPMILDQASPDVYGLMGGVMGAGMVIGTIVMSAWGGPKRRIFGVALGDIFAGFCFLLMGIRPSLVLITVGGFLAMFAMPITNGSSQALWQSKVAADVQGRVFAVRRMIAFSIIPIANLLSGPLADNIFTPAMMPGGALANTWVGQVLGVGPGRGAGLLIVLGSLAYALLSTIHLIHPRIRRVEIELPDAQPEAAPIKEEAIEAGAGFPAIELPGGPQTTAG
jgi:MFS family permease